MQTKSLPAKAFAVLASFILAFSLLGQAAFPRTSEAVTWAEYLSGKWQECKDDFASWDKTTSLKPWDGTSVQPTQGSGTPTDPYKITTPEQLAWVMGSAPQASRSFVLMNDLDLGGLQRKNWLPSDQGSITNEVVMDGNGHTIYNMHIERSSGSYKQPGLGFISHVDNPNWTMKNITFKFAEVKRTGGSHNFSVGVGYFVRGTLDTVSVQDSIVEGADFTGALAVGWDTGYKATDDGATWKESTTGTYITNCNAQRVYTYGNSCSGNFTGL